MKTITDEKCTKVLMQSGVRYFREGGFYWRIPLNGKIKRSRTEEIVKIYGDVILKIENDDVFGERVIS